MSSCFASTSANWRTCPKKKVKSRRGRGGVQGYVVPLPLVVGHLHQAADGLLRLFAELLEKYGCRKAKVLVRTDEVLEQLR